MAYHPTNDTNNMGKSSITVMSSTCIIMHTQNQQSNTNDKDTPLWGNIDAQIIHT